MSPVLALPDFLVAITTIGLPSNSDGPSYIIIIQSLSFCECSHGMPDECGKNKAQSMVGDI